MATMERKFEDLKEENVSWSHLPFIEIRSDESNYFQGFNEKKLLKIACEKNLCISFLYKQATYLIKGIVFMKVYGTGLFDDECKHDLLSATDFFKGQPIDRNADYGFNQLTEVAIKALSPGINDPGTAVISLHSLSDLFAYKLYHNLPSVRLDNEGVKRIYIPCSSFDDMFEKCIHPIWNYGKNDEYIQKEITHMLKQLIAADHKKLYTVVFDNLMKEIEKQKKFIIENN